MRHAEQFGDLASWQANGLMAEKEPEHLKPRWLGEGREIGN